MAGLMSMCPNSTDEHNENNTMYSMMEGFDEECLVEESGHKKRRLGLDQVKALEKNFEVENKLEPERKVKLARELGLQPRQVAVWFQNRRARWKTKQLERDYGVLKANHDGLKLNFEKLQCDNESLLKELRELKSKLYEDGNSEDEPKLETPVDKSAELDATEIENVEIKNVEILEGVTIFGDFKDGSSDSDSSAILNEDNNNSSPTAAAAISSINHDPKFMNDSSSNFQFSEANYKGGASYQPQFVKIEEHNFFGEESCTTFFSDDQAPTLHWYCSDQWN